MQGIKLYRFRHYYYLSCMQSNFPPYQTFPTLTSKEIILRQLTHTDAADILEISYYNGVQAVDLSEAIEMLNKINQDYLDGSSIHWGIVDAQSEKLVGTCGYYRGFANDIGELGYVLKPAFQGRGFMTRALQQAIVFGIHTVGLQKIIAVTEKNNMKSQHVLGRLGFSEESSNEDYITYSYPVK